MTRTAPTARITTLDAVRGCAVMGILLMNIISFSMPGSAYVHPLTWGGTSFADLSVWAVNQLLFEGRMRGLFALLFGASAMLVMARAKRSGQNPIAVHLPRMFVLALIGLAHMILVWDGDVLFHYAVIGLVIWPLRKLEPYKLLALAIIVLGLHTIFWSGVFLDSLYAAHLAAQPGASPAEIQSARDIYASLPGAGDPTIAEALRTMRGGYAGIVAQRWGEIPFLPVKFLTMMGGETLGYMLLGMALYASGFFTGGWDAGAVERLTWRCYAIALPVLAALTVADFASGFDRIVVMGHFLGWSVPFRVLCAVGHLGLASMLLRRFAGSAAVDRIAAVGRMALSNYLTTSVVMTTIFYGYGFGLFGHVARAQVYLFVFAMWAAMLLWSKPWLARFRYGPAEWLWRTLARRELQPLRGAAA